MGTLSLDKNGDVVTPQLGSTIFHVFSEDFVQEELRERQYEVDGEIENQIAVDSESIKIKDAQDALAKAQTDEQAAEAALREKFDKDKLAELAEKVGINKQLKEYKELTFDRLLERFSDKPEPPKPSVAEIIKDLDALKAIPSDPIYPDDVGLVPSDNIYLKAIEDSLGRITSPSSVSEDIKKKIDDHREFYATGTNIVQDEHLENCPFCEQGISAGDPKAIIDAYVEYFSDAEEKHKNELRVFFRALLEKEATFKELENQLSRQKSRFDTLKSFVPSQKDVALDDGAEELKNLRASLFTLKDVIQKKADALTAALSMPESNLSVNITAVNDLIAANNSKAQKLTRAVEKSGEERRDLQRKACAAFEAEFAITNWTDIETLRTLLKATIAAGTALLIVEKSSPSTDARTRVAETFELLLKDFFSDKYVLDKDKFILKRGTCEMTRGPHRTLSDGEKTVIAFCYFVACVHRKVEANSDYRKLFLVFDDPVTSMSYDYVFSIAQTLKNLSISDQGEVSINPGQIDGNKYLRPELLILTHSSYFFNICLTNRIVDERKGAAFALQPDSGIHKLVRLKEYVAPFKEQLRDVYDVAKGRDPDHRTANSVRSVLEAIGRFCRPDKSESLSTFVQHLAGDEGIAVKSVLINSLCHGTYYEETPVPGDLKLACEETIVVVGRFAVGQLELIEGAADTGK
ncbi:Wobble nucleotide-excising tRNase [Litoreibacter ascidiaceicola]|uniref:Wobble nucleotide-excising tRNase n=2 Tax=Litoreibacter ascidiaceicola TaxID=1486859 RepID=A0A1M5E690_9RHOB|nr:Wobble nucleotide-excising tRNase [Litoreibacter ascidiaceicola]